MTKETFWKSIPRDTPYSASVRLRFFGEASDGSFGGCSGASFSFSEVGSLMTFTSSVARMIS